MVWEECFRRTFSAYCLCRVMANNTPSVFFKELMMKKADRLLFDEVMDVEWSWWTGRRLQACFETGRRLQACFANLFQAFTFQHLMLIYVIKIAHPMFLQCLKLAAA